MTLPPKRISRFSEQERRARKTDQERRYRKHHDKDGLKFRHFDAASFSHQRKSRRSAVPPTKDCIAHEKQRDIDFRRQILEELQQTLDDSNVLDTWGLVTASVVKEILSKASPPTPNLEQGISKEKAEALFLQTENARRLLSSSSTIDVLVFAQGQQDFAWSSDSRPITQLLAKYTDLDEEFYVDIASLPHAGASYFRTTIAAVQSHFAENIDHGDAWNVLNFNCALPDTYGICPKFLQNDNCDLLSRIKRAISQGSAGRAVVKTANLIEWRAVERWVLLGDPFSLTGPHMDSNAYEMFINNNEGEIGIAWLSRPTEEQLQDWAKDPNGFQGGSWRFSVLRPRMSIWFPTGTVHVVFRLRGDGRQAMGIGGHVLRCSAVAQWAKIIALRLLNPNATNEKITKTAPKYLQAVVELVTEAAAAGRLEQFGGKENAAEFGRQAENCHDILHKRYPRMKLEPLLQAITLLSEKLG